ncbi:MAG: P-II family nitrogen regulator [Rubrivivax sp.]
MSYKYVVAVLRPDVIAQLETRLSQIGIGGITLSRVKGFGETRNFFSADRLTEHTKLEVFVEESQVDALLSALRDTALPGVPGAGIAAVMPVDEFQPLHARIAAAPGGSS